ncbi:hypothetical protein GQ600_21287 [Phytophthora cactorum]|nr:hypothetical protein GQ600_21287 [Phytophthora cactorum]
MFLGAVLGPLQPIVLELGWSARFQLVKLRALRRTHVDATGHVPPKYFYASPEWVMVFMTAATFIVFLLLVRLPSTAPTSDSRTKQPRNSRSRGNKDNILITRASRGTGSFF